MKSTNTQSNPKTIKPQKRVNEYPKEPFTVASGKLFCQRCREELPLKKSSIEYHIKSGKHDEGKKRLGKGSTMNKSTGEVKPFLNSSKCSV